MGYEDPVRAFKTSVGKQQQYKCPICIVGSTYNFIHMALKRHEQLTTVAVPAEGGEQVITEGEEEVITEATPPVPKNTSEPSQHNESKHDEVISHLSGDISHLSNISHVSDSRRSWSGSHRHDTAIPSHQPRGQRSTTGGSGNSFRHVTSKSELRRVKRCKGMLYGLKNIGDTVDTLTLLDSNGRDIKAEHIDGNGRKVCLRQIGGLCCAATTQALKECKPRYPNIKDIYLGLGTNDHLHAGEHPGERVEYIKALDHEVRKVFPSAMIHFLLPFTAIHGLGVRYVKNLADSIKDADVRWKIHQPPGMKGKLVTPALIHLTPAGRAIFTKWLSKTCARGAPLLTAASGRQSQVASHPIQRPINQVQNGLGHVLNIDGRGHIGVDAPSGKMSVDSQYAGSYPVQGVGIQERGGDLNNRPNVLVQRDAGVSNNINLDSLLKERLFELVMAPQTYFRPSNYRARWD